MNPTDFLLAMLALCLAAAISQGLLRLVYTKPIRKLAREWGMHYSSKDRLRLSDRVAERLPFPGAADVRVMDLLYATESGRHRYLFTAEYGRGVIGPKTRVRRAVGLNEPMHRGESPAPVQLMLAPEDLPIVEQYQLLYDQAK